MKKLIIVVLFLLSGCGGGAVPQGNPVVEKSAFPLTRVIDSEAGVVCWQSPVSGLSCLPINDTLLRGQ